MRKILATVLIATVVLVMPKFTAEGLAAGGASSGEIIVSADSGANASDGSPSTAWDGTSFFTVWIDGTDIYGARVSLDGEVLDPDGIAISTGLNGSTSEPRPPSVAFDGTNYFVVWVSTRAGVSEIYGCRVSPDGTVLDPAGIKITTGGSPKVKPVGIVFNGSEYFIVWRTSSDVIRGIHVNTDGVVVGEPAGFQVMAWGFYPTVAYDAADGVYLVAAYRGSYTELSVHCARVQTDGTVLDTEPITLCAAGGTRAYPRVAFDGTNFMVIWSDSRSDATGLNGSLYGARVSPDDGTMLGQPFLIAYRVIQNAFPNLVFDGTDYLAVWSTTTADYWVAEKFRLPDSYAARISTEGTVLDRQAIPLSTAFAHQVGTSVAYGGGRYFAVWNDLRQSFNGGKAAIYGRIFDKGIDSLQTPYDPQALPAEVTWTGQIVGIARGAASGLATDSENARLFGTNNSLVYQNGTWSVDGNADSGYACYATGASDIWAGGWAGFVKNYSDAGWVDHRPESGSPLVTGFWGNQHDDVWASLSSVRAFTHFDGNQWQNVASACDSDVQDIMGAGPDDVWAVGERGAVQHWDGSAWSAVQGIPTMQTLNSLWVNSSDDAFAVGDHGTILHWDGASWNAQISPTNAHLKDVWGVDGENVYAVGTCGTVLYYDGTSWSLENAGTVNDLLTVFGGFGDDGTCKLWAAGYSPAVLSKTIETAAPVTAEPEGFRVEAVGSDSVDLAWTLPNDRNMTGYTLEYRAEGETEWTGIPLSRTDGHTVTDLNNSKAYSFRLRALYRYAYESPNTTELANVRLKLAVCFHSQGGTEIPTSLVNYGEAVACPSDPTRDDSYFSGWFTDISCAPDKEWDFDTPVTTNLELFARWLSDTCYVCFDPQDGTPPVTVGIPRGTAVARPADLSRVGHTFVGWYTGADFEIQWDFAGPVLDDMTLFAKWELSQYTVTFQYLDGITTPSQETVRYAEPYGDLPHPTREGYGFGGWFTSAEGGDRVESGDFVSALADHTLYARWTLNQYTVYFDSQNGAAPYGVEVNYSAKIAAPTVPTKPGHSFVNWYKDAACTNAWRFDIDTVPAHDITLYAGWTANEYTIAVSANNTSYGTVSGGGSIAYGAPVTVRATPKTGYRFVRWLECSTAVSTSASYTFNVTKARTLKAEFAPIPYAIAVSANSTSYGTVTGGGSYTPGTFVTVRATPKTGYRFVSWLEGSTAVSTNWEYKFTVTKARTLKAEFAAIGIPGSVKAAVAGYNSAKITWAAVTGAKEYEVYRAISGGTYSKIATTTATNCISTGLATGTAYYYKVRAKCVAGSTTTYGGYSAIVSAKPILATPGSFAATSAGYSSVKISWAAVSGAHAYELYYSTSSSGTYTKVATTSTLTATKTGLTTNRAYYFKVRAYRTVGSMKVYGAFTAVKYAKPVPATPGSFTAVASSTLNSVKATWAAVSGASGYEVYYSTYSCGTYSRLTTTTATSYTKTGLSPGKAYYFKVRVYRTVSGAKIYGSFTAYKGVALVPATPGSMKAARASSTSVEVSWGAVSGATKYELYRATSSAGTYTKLTETTSTSYTNSGLTTGKTYYYKVRAYRLVGRTKVYGGFSLVVYTKP